MGSRRNQQRTKSEMNVVPYIDVMLVLLVIFMISAPLLNQSVEVDLPQSNNSEEIDQSSHELQAPFVISIDKKNTYYIDQADGNALPITKEEIQIAVAKKIKQSPSINMYIRADKEVAYGAVMTVMDLMKSAGADHVGLVTKTEEN